MMNLQSEEKVLLSGENIFQISRVFAFKSLYFIS